MGSCLSSSSSANYDPSPSQLTAKVITLNGTLREYSVTVSVSQVLSMEMTTSCFLCNSDRLYYDEHIQALDAKEELQPGQIYFVLPTTRLQYRLTAADMAGLAVKASSALVSNSKKSFRRKRMRISPITEVNQRVRNEELDEMKKFEKASGGITRSGSVRKMQRSASRRAKLAIRSFRMRLSTIYEGSVVD